MPATHGRPAASAELSPVTPETPGRGPSGAPWEPRPSRGVRRALLAAAAAAAVAVGALVVLGAVRPTQLRSADPGDRATTATAPDTVALTFDGTPALTEYHLGVSATDGTSVTSGAVRLERDRLAVPVRIDTDGTYLVGYHLLFTDGRELTGFTRFTVSAAGPADPGSTTVAAQTTQAAHAHSGTDPLSAAFVVLDAVLVVALLVLLLRRPRRARCAAPPETLAEPSDPASPTSRKAGPPT